MAFKISTAISNDSCSLILAHFVCLHVFSNNRYWHVTTLFSRVSFLVQEFSGELSHSINVMHSWLFYRIFLLVKIIVAISVCNLWITSQRPIWSLYMVMSEQVSFLIWNRRRWMALMFFSDACGYHKWYQLLIFPVNVMGIPCEYVPLYIVVHS